MNITKTCGGCTLCCKLPEIQVLSKPAGQMCTHCNIGVGCDAYEYRPDDCRQFRCIWITSPLSDRFRPDKMGILFEMHKAHKTVIGLVEEGASWKSGRPMRLIMQMVNDGYTVWVVDGTERNLFLPSGETKQNALAKAQTIWGEAWQHRPMLKT